MIERTHASTRSPYFSVTTHGHITYAQVARYTDSQRYVDHFDAVDPHSPAGRSFCANGGQRVATVLMYLNDVREGGSTFFRLLDLAIQVWEGALVCGARD